MLDQLSIQVIRFFRFQLTPLVQTYNLWGFIFPQIFLTYSHFLSWFFSSLIHILHCSILNYDFIRFLWYWITYYICRNTWKCGHLKKELSENVSFNVKKLKGFIQFNWDCNQPLKYSSLIKLFCFVYNKLHTVHSVGYKLVLIVIHVA